MDVRGLEVPAGVLAHAGTSVNQNACQALETNILELHSLLLGHRGAASMLNKCMLTVIGRRYIALEK